MIKKKIEVDVDLTDFELIDAISAASPVNRIKAVNRIARDITDEEVLQVVNHFGTLDGLLFRLDELSTRLRACGVSTESRDT